MKPREWRLGEVAWAPVGRLIAYEPSDVIPSWAPPPVHVREVLPGMIEVPLGMLKDIEDKLVSNVPEDCPLLAAVRLLTSTNTSDQGRQE